MIKKYFIKETLIISFITLILLTLVNFAFVYNSPYLVKLLPQDIIRTISPCYRTLFHHNGLSLSNSNFVFGDSFTEGSGDEFRNGDPRSGIFRKLDNQNNSDLIFGRSGYSNIGTVLEFERCFPLLSSYTSFPLGLIKNYTVTLVFYEGNDLDNNIRDVDLENNNNLKYNFRFLFPVFDYLYIKSYHEYYKVKRQLVLLRDATKIFYKYLFSEKLESSILLKSVSKEIKMFPKSVSGVQLGRFPQSAATELSDKEILESLQILKDSLTRIRKKLPIAKEYRLLFLPSVASSYQFKNTLIVQSYKGKKYFKTSGEFNLLRSKLIRDSANIISNDLKWKFCDTTPIILDTTKQGFAVHGPKDWKHFNKLGYTLVAKFYERCFH